MLNIEEYCDVLSRLLKSRLPDSRVEELVKEIRSHLIESRAAQAELELSEREAERTAVCRMGSPRAVADRMIYEESGLGRMSPWRIAWLPCALLAICWIWPFALLYTNGPWMSFIGTMQLFSIPFTASLIWACWRSRRLLVKPIVTTVAALTVVSILAMGLSAKLGPVADHDWAGSALAQNQEQSAKVERFLQTGSIDSIRSNQGFEAPQVWESRYSYSLSYVPVAIPTGSAQTASLTGVPTREMAEQLWKQNAVAMKAHLENERAQIIAARDQSLATIWFRSIYMAALYGAVSIAYLLMLNAIIVALTRVRERRLARSL